MRLPTLSSDPCQETTGFLFKHPCPEPVVNRCDQCQKLTCEKHSAIRGANTYCTTCAQHIAKSDPNSFADNDPFDPYWYSTSHYRGYGYYGHGYWGNSYMSDFDSSSGTFAANTYRESHDPNDFTEADGAAVQAEGDASFENEIGGS